MKIRTAYFLILIVLLSCFVQQCQLLMFGLIANSLSSAIASAMTMTSAVGINMFSSLFQSFISTVGHGFSTLHTMTMALISGFMMGTLFFAGFLFFLLAIVPAEEFRSLGGNSIFNSPAFSRPLLPYIPFEFTNATGLDRINENITLARNKRSLPSLVNRNNASTLRFTLTPSSPMINGAGRKFEYDLRFASDKKEGSRMLNNFNYTDTRLPRLFLTGLAQRDPFNCLPLLLCGLSAARKPSERTEVLNDYAYLLKEFMEPDEDDKSDEDSSEDDFTPKRKNKNRFRQEQLDLLTQLINGNKKQDEVDKMIDEMRKEEEEKIEDLALTEMADDPNDLTFALEDMKVRGLKKTMSRLPNQSKKDYLAKLVKDDSGEGEMMDSELYSDEQMGGYPYGRNNYRGSLNRNRDDYYYDLRGLAKGGFPPLPPAPPVPQYGLEDDRLYKKNLKLLEHSLSDGPPPMQRRRSPIGPWRRSKRQVRWNGPPPPRGFLQKKRGEAATADNIFDRARVGAEVGARAGNNRQCRALFNECPVQSLIKPVGDSNTPFLNRAVNNIRRVILGTPPEGSKQRRVNEIREVIQQLQPPARNHGGSEVRVVLNIGPSPPPTGPSDLHRAGGSPPPAQYVHTFNEGGLVSSSSSVQPPQNDYSHTYTSFKNPAPPTSRRPAALVSSTTTIKPDLKPPKKVMKYKKPSLPSPRPTKDLSDLENLLKATLPSANSDEDSTTDFPQEETTVITFSDEVSPDSIENDGEMEDEPVLPTSFPVSKEEYAENLRETFEIFKRFKEANKKPFSIATTSKPTIRPRSTTTKKSSSKVQQQSSGNKNKPQAGDISQSDLPQKDVEKEEDDVQSILDWIQKFREKYFPKNKAKRKKKRKKKKKKKKKRPADSSEESSEEHGPDPHYHNPTLVAVPHPEIKNQIHWKSGTSLLKDGVYHLFFGGKQTRPLPKTPQFHPSSESADANHVHYHEPPSPPVIHHHHRSRNDISATNESEDGPTTLPPFVLSSSTRHSVPKTKKSKAKAKSKLKGLPTISGPVIVTRRPIKIKLKTPKPIVLPESNEDDFEMFHGLPPPPPPLLPPHMLTRLDDSSGSYEDEDEDLSVDPTRPQLLYSPFALNRGRPPNRPPSNKRSKKGSAKASPTVSSGRSMIAQKGRNKSKAKGKGTSKPSSTTTVKPKRKILKYKNG